MARIIVRYDNSLHLKSSLLHYELFVFFVKDKMFGLQCTILSTYLSMNKAALGFREDTRKRICLMLAG
jgi:hypothetical protein